jgi:hypothetical protein
VEEVEIQRLNIVRRAFSHNQFPSKTNIGSILKGEKPLITEIMEFVLKSYQSFAENLNTKYAN